MKNKKFIIAENYSDSELNMVIGKHEKIDYNIYEDKNFIIDGMDVIRAHLHGGFHILKND